ncbi:unnamed protein product [Prunus brigantina]
MMAQKNKPKPKPNYDRKAKHPDYVQFRCNVNAFNSIITDVKDKLNERQKKLLKKTPFWNLIELFYHERIDMNNMNKSDLDLVQLLKKFDPNTKSFKFGTKAFKITGNAVTQILGLPHEGKSVKLVNDRYTATFRIRHFGEKGKPSKNQVEAELLKTISLANQPKKEKAKAGQKKKTNKGKEKKEAEEEEEEEVDYDKEVVAICTTPWTLMTSRYAIFNLIVQGILKAYKKRKTTREEEGPLDKKKEKEDDEGQQREVKEAEDQGKPDDADQTPELKEDGKKKMFENEAGNDPLAIQDLLVKSMTDQINYRQRQDPSFVCPERLQLWKDEINEDSEKKMKELWDIFIQGEKRSKELEAKLATYVEKLDNEEYVTATMTVESTVQLQEIQNLKRRIVELEGKETRIEMEKIAKKKEIEEKYKVEIQSLLSDPTIFEMEMDLPTTQPVEEQEEEEEKQQEEKEEEKKQDAPTPDVPSRVLRLKNRERKRLQASCYVYEKKKNQKRTQKRMMKNYHNSSLSLSRSNQHKRILKIRRW